MDGGLGSVKVDVNEVLWNTKVGFSRSPVTQRKETITSLATL